MDKQRPPYHWTTQQLSDSCQISECPDYDNYKDFKRDPTGYYVLIKINFELSRVEVGICDKDHKIVGIFRGRKSQDIYNAIFKREKNTGAAWFQEKTHIAYLGKELKKAELALVMGHSSYFQE
jgi:hypothetical protein